MWLNSDTLKKGYVRNIYSNLKFRASLKTRHAMWFRQNNNGGSKRACKWACKCYQYFSWFKTGILGIHVLYTVTNTHSNAGILLKVSNVFRSEILALFTVTSIHRIQKRTKNRNPKTRWKLAEDSRLYKAQASQKIEIKSINEEVWGKEKVSDKRNLLIHNVKVI